jgi:aldose 1-epimerase
VPSRAEAHVLAADGVRAVVLELGATLGRLEVDGVNVVLGLESPEPNPAYFGATIGRCAARIDGGRFELDGVEYHVTPNEPPSSVHGGAEGFDRKRWTVLSASRSELSVRYVSPDGEEGYPGEVDARATYSVAPDVLRVEYTATTTAPTVVNLTNHSYWNLAGEGEGDVLDHVVTIAADEYLPLGEHLIPVGREPVAGTALDFRAPHPIGERIDGVSDQLLRAGGYDHNYLLRPGDGLTFAVRVDHPPTGRRLEVWTTEPAIDFYTGNFLDGSLSGPSGRPYGPRAGLAIEPERPSNAINDPRLPSPVLRPGERYRHVTEYRFSRA